MHPKLATGPERPGWPFQSLLFRATLNISVCGPFRGAFPKPERIVCNARPRLPPMPSKVVLSYQTSFRPNWICRDEVDV